MGAELFQIASREDAALDTGRIMVLRQSLRMAAAGILAGGGAALAVSQVIQSEYHGIQKIDPGAFGGAAALFVAAMLVATAVPAVRASRVDPVANLKDG